MGAIAKDEVVGVVGAGVMGAGIAQVAATAGHNVVLWDSTPGAVQQAKERISKQLAERVERGRITEPQRAEVLGKLQVSSSPLEMRGAGLIIEAIVEDLGAKQGLFAGIEPHVSEQAILATNTSSLSITKIASVLKHPERFAGLHFFNPAPAMPLVEVVSGLQTSSTTADRLLATCIAWGKEPILAKSVPGFVVNRGARPYYGEPARFVEEGGADFATVDSLLRAAGFRMGTFELLDLIGLDVNLKVSEQMVGATYGEPRYRPSPLVVERVEAGLLGRKTGRGFFDYAGSKPQPSMLPNVEMPVPSKIRLPESAPVGLAERLQAIGCKIETWERAWMEADGARFMITQGTLAAAWSEGMVILDAALDWRTCGHLAFTDTSSVSPFNRESIVSLFQMMGISLSLVRDLPGLVVARTVCMLINEGFESVFRGVASEDMVDLAMEKGMGFPGGPFAWCERLGAGYCVRVLDNLARLYGEDRYRASLLLRRTALELES